ncbi:Glutamyl/glutaminyl-tRNA synthetase, class Ib [Corchorus capsularis]|uniref:glutamine--tRNA ligase n=1 Tax=Corchorus capsularis TaxID=210143 RepID=A0A1R3HRM5_COCAP|nr:Glutamyl/glutaminyl-tRNA synthetase, class Ib [Corchorus capsularis]
MGVKDENSYKTLDLFLKIGLDERTARNTIANNKVTANLTAVIHEASLTDGCDRTIGNLLYTVATKYPANAILHRPKLLEYVVSYKIKSPAQLEAAFSFLSNVASENFKQIDFEEACGVGVEVSVEEITQTVNEIFEEKKAVILEQRYRYNVGELLGSVRDKHRWADAKIAKQLVDAKMYELLGERTAADDVKPSKKKEKKEKPAKVENKVAEVTPAPPSEEELNPFSIFPVPEDNIKLHTEVFFSNGSVLRCCNTREMLDKHLRVTGGRVFTRFPPEPNGYLHIGHAKAMFVDFGLAKERGGCCYLRYDDTNPEAEKKEYINHIEEIVQWMGWEPFKITYTSDYFQELYDLAVELIRRGHAYVDHQTPEEIKEYREKKMNSPWRDRPIAESLKLFDDMKSGLIEEGKATIRMKQDMQSDNGNMYDLIAYRIKFTPHPHAGDKWCIYPSYDYAHCIVDSLENITHSLCTLEFETRRASYYWLLHVLGLYQPYVWEYSRLNVTNTVMSKRKLNYIVTNKYVDGWDDPRLMTLAGLRRRGVTSTAINAFVRGIGITRSDCSMIRLDRLEYHIREELNKTAPRVLVVLHPLKVVITNLEASSVMDLDAKKWPDAQEDDKSAFYKVPFSNVVYIERSDFRMKDSKDYYGLAPGKSVLLRYAFPIKCTDVILADDKETVLEIRAEYDPSKSKQKGVLHWVAEPSPGADPLKVEVRLFEKLFNSENPAELDNWLADLNPDSKVVIPAAYAVPALRNAAVGNTFQFERLGYFTVDKDSTAEKLVFNCTVTLKDTYNPLKVLDVLISSKTKVICVISWGVAEIPQIVTNYKEKSIEGLSLGFLITWIIGDLFNLFGCMLESTTLYTMTTSILTAQTVYYSHIYPRLKCRRLCQRGSTEHQPEAVEKAGKHIKNFGVKQVIDADRLSSPIPLPRKSSGRELYYMSARSLSRSHTPTTGSFLAQRMSPPHNGNSVEEPLLSAPISTQSASPTSTKSLLCLVSVLMFIGTLNFQLSAWNNLQMKHEKGFVIQLGRKLLQVFQSAVKSGSGGGSGVGTFLGWAMAAIYMGGRLPQICLNGLNPFMFIFALVGNSTYVASILVNSVDWSIIKPNLPWLVDAGGCVLLDTFILIQFIYFCNWAPQVSEDKQENLSAS